jgi:pimeloyl-ACP methyl ester carboxylesterase
MTFFWILIVLLLLIFSIDQLIERMYQYEKKPHFVTPDKHKIGFEEIHIPSVKDSQLFGWWIPTSPDAPTLILLHGWGRNLSRMMPYIQKLHPLGYNLLAFDARNHGSSSPEKHLTVGTFSEDILAVVDFLGISDLTSSDSIGVLGLSIGGGAAINAAGWDARIKSVVTVGAISHPVAVMNYEFQKRHIPNFIVGAILWYMRLRFRLDFDKIAPVKNIAQANAAFLLIHGDEDETVPLAQGQALAKAGNPTQTRLWVVPGKGHSNCHNHPLFWGKVDAFLKETLFTKENK